MAISIDEEEGATGLTEGEVMRVATQITTWTTEEFAVFKTMDLRQQLAMARIKLSYQHSISSVGQDKPGATTKVAPVGVAPKGPEETHQISNALVFEVL